MIADGEIDKTFLISHRLSLDEAPKGYKEFSEQKNRVTEVVLRPKPIKATDNLTLKDRVYAEVAPR